MEDRKRIHNKNIDNTKLEELRNKQIERLKESKKMGRVNITMDFKQHEIKSIQTKTKAIRALYGLTRTKVLRKVLLNLDDEELLHFLNLLPSDELKK